MKITIPTELWVKLYCELSAYVENKCYPEEGIFIGSYFERSEDNFCEIADEIESILGSHFKKRED